MTSQPAHTLLDMSPALQDDQWSPVSQQSFNSNFTFSMVQPLLGQGPNLRP